MVSSIRYCFYWFFSNIYHAMDMFSSHIYDFLLLF
jgi:hypothetical protein